MKPSVSFAALAAGLCLAGCGGGSGAGSAPATSIVTPSAGTGTSPTSSSSSSTQSFRTPEYLQMGPLDQIHAADAYALGYTGKGVTIGIVDFNFDFTSSEVVFDPASVGPNPKSLALYQAQTGETPSSDMHGFAVAATAAAQKDNIGGEGVAFDAKVLAVDFFSGVNETQTVQDGVVYHVSDPWTYITSHGVRIINTSFGYEASDVISNPPHVTEAYVLASAATAVVNGALLVSSAGNAGGASPSLSNFDILSDMQSFGVLNSGPGAFIIVGAVDSNNQIASFSDRAGTAKDHYMVAPGTNFLLPWNGGMAFVSGTSFSAPLVSGAAALIFQRWPNLTARDVANILFASATDLGASGVDDVYGNGLLNVAAALQPIGVSTTVVANGTAPPVSATDLVLGPAFGDAPALHRALASVMILDSFGRDFEADLSSRVNTRPNLPDLFGVLEQRLGWREANLALGDGASFSFDMRHNPEDGIVPFQTLAGPEDRFTHATMMRVFGVTEGIAWTAGNGLSLRDGMMGNEESPFAGGSLTNAFSPLVGAAPGAMASFRLPLSSDTGLSFGAGVSENQGLTDHLRTPFRNSAETTELRLDHERGKSRFSLEIGDAVETGDFMGSLAAGGLTMDSRASTVWTTASAETALDAHWSLRGALTLAGSAAAHPQASLITEIGPVYATSFALGLAGENLFGSGDVLSFTLAQPLRAEHGMLTLVTGVARDWSTGGGVILGANEASLTPSGREFDLETGYRFDLSGWGVGANLAYAIDPDHVQNTSAVIGLFTLSRTF
jgi:hypothetical protein